MQFDNQKTRNVAEAVKKILAGETVSEELKGNQHKIDANKNGKIDKQDFEMLHKEKGVKQEASCDKMKKEETELTESHFKVGDEVKCKASGMTGKVVKLDKEHGEEDDKYYTVKREDGKEMKYAPKELSLVKEENLDEATPSRQQVKQAIGIARDKRYAGGNMTGAMKAMSKINKGLGQHPAVAKELKKQNEDVEQLDEYTPDKSGVTRIQGRAYGASKPEKHAVDTMSGPTRKQLSAIEKEKKVKKPFKEMLELYADKGLKALSEMTMTEEPDQEQFEKELEMAKKKATQKKTPEEEAGVAKAAVQSVKVEEDVEQLDELSPKTLGSYAKKAQRSLHNTNYNKGLGSYGYHTPEGDKFIAKRTAGAKKAIDKLVQKKMNNEEAEQLDELSPQTLGSYAKKAVSSANKLHQQAAKKDRVEMKKADRAGKNYDPESTWDTPHFNKFSKRRQGITRAVNRLSKEEVEQINERPMTDAEMDKREDIVKGMKKNLKGFKDRYGDRAKSVMYATATKTAMKDED